jgi:hypothetical protein
MSIRFVVILVSYIIVVGGCNNNNTTSTDEKGKADSLFREVMDGHNVGMAKMHEIEKAKTRATSLIDSLGKLPQAAREASAQLKARLDTLVKDLDYADFAMNKWMEEFKFDSAKNDLTLRIPYLENERMKVTRVKEAILSSLGQADTLLRKKP